jgi:hypothetical protein
MSIALNDLKGGLDRDLVGIAQFEVNAITHSELDELLSGQDLNQAVVDHGVRVATLSDPTSLPFAGSNERRFAIAHGRDPITRGVRRPAHRHDRALRGRHPGVATYSLAFARDD